MLRNNLVRLNLTKSIFLLLIGSIILAILISFNNFASTFNSTGFLPTTNYFYLLKNKIADSLLQIFGISIYLIPFAILFWSYKLFFNKPITKITFKIVLLTANLFILPLIVNYFVNNSYGGILGEFLNYNLYAIHNYYFIFLIIGMVFLCLITGITLQDCLTSFNLILFFINLAVKYSFNKLLLLNAKLKSRFIFSMGEVRTKKSIAKPELGLEGIIKNLEDEELYDSPSEHTNFTHNNYNEAASSKISFNNSVSSISHTRDSEDSVLPYGTNYKNLHNGANVASGGFASRPLPERGQVVVTSSSRHEAIETNNSEHSNNNYDSLINATSLNANNKPEANGSTARVAVSKKIVANNYKSYELPTDLLDFKEERTTTTNQEIKETALKLESVIREFGIEGKIVNIQTGPVVTLFEIAIPPGVKTSKLTVLDADISLRMKAFSVRIAIVPGKDVIGIEIPNAKRKTVYLRKLLENKGFKESEHALPMNLGFDISGKPVVADLATMPHLLVAGTTGSGKSVAVNAMILSLLYRLSPEQCKMIMIDPKMLELSIYQDIPHLLTPVVTDSKKAIYALKWAVKQMEHRYTLMSHLGVRNLNGYNEKLKDTKSVEDIAERLRVIHQLDLEFIYMPYIVIIIDEMADLMLVAGKEIESAVQRLAQMARAAGIHLIMATQRPSVDVITGTIKANFPTRISFQVSSKIDSRTILGEQGAERLLGKGDMLYMMGVGRLQRVHGPFVGDTEVEKVVTLLRKLGSPNYIDEVTKDESVLDDAIASQGDSDELYNEVVDLIRQEGKVSTSYIQRRFQIGYNRAARIVDMLEHNGVISKATATGKREILIN